MLSTSYDGRCRGRERKEDPSSPTPTPSPLTHWWSWCRFQRHLGIGMGSCVRGLAKKKRAKKTQICRDVEDSFFWGGGIFLTPLPSQSKKWIDAAVWTPFLYTNSPKRCQYAILR